MIIPLEKAWDQEHRVVVLMASAAMIVAIALVDWWTKPYVILGLLYLFPIMLAAGFLPRWAVAVLGFGCALLSKQFSGLAPSGSGVRLGLETVALAACGLFVSELIRSRRLNLEAQDRLRTIVETSPAAIVIVDGQGTIDLANGAASDLMKPNGDNPRRS